MLSWRLSANYTIPAAGATATASFSDTYNMWPGALLSLEDTSCQSLMEVQSVVSTTSAILINRFYSHTPPPAHTYPSGSFAFCIGAGSSTATGSGLVPTPPNDTTKYLRGDSTWATVAAGGGTKTFSVFSALDANPPATLFGVFTTRNSIPVIGFNDSTSWSSFFIGAIPESASTVSGLVVRIHWMAGNPATTSGNVFWRIYFEKMNTDEDSDSFDAVNAAASSAANATASGIITLSSTTCTNIDGLVAGDPYRVKIDRDAANPSDTMVGDAQIVVVEVRGV